MMRLYYLQIFMMPRKLACKHRLHCLNIINEVIFNINSSAPAFLKTVYGLGTEAIVTSINSFYSMAAPGSRFLWLGPGLFMNDKSKPLLVTGSEE